MGNTSQVTGFLRTRGKALVNGEGQEILLRGVGLGSWLLPEGYMWLFPKEGDRPRRIEGMIEQLIGAEKAREFWRLYHASYITESDIRQIAAEGFNSLRIPINSRFLLEKGEEVAFDQQNLGLIDQVIDWCEAYGLYAILDLHGAPGGQTGSNIDDSLNDQPELFTRTYNQRVTIELWQMLAARYADRWIVAGYDLLNEPLPEWFSQYNDKVVPLYKEIVKAIRKVDKNHMIILEGVHWATDWSIFTEVIDGNVMLQFHKYWNNPDVESVQTYLDKREEWDVPIFMGEGGENNKEYYTGLLRLLEDLQISWNFWTWKKMETSNSPCSIKAPDGWRSLVDFLQGKSTLDSTSAERILWQYLDNVLFEKCNYHQDVIRSIFRRPSVRIPAAFYDYRGEGVSFGIKDRTSKSPVSFRVGDHTDLRFLTGGRSTANFQHGQGQSWQEDEWIGVGLQAGDWLTYTFQVTQPPRNGLNVKVCVLGQGGELELTVHRQPVGIQSVSSQGWQVLNFYLDSFFLVSDYQIGLTSRKSKVVIKWITIEEEKGDADE